MSSLNSHFSCIFSSYMHFESLSIIRISLNRSILIILEFYCYFSIIGICKLFLWHYYLLLFQSLVKNFWTKQNQVSNCTRIISHYTQYLNIFIDMLEKYFPLGKIKWWKIRYFIALMNQWWFYNCFQTHKNGVK